MTHTLTFRSAALLVAAMLACAVATAEPERASVDPAFVDYSILPSGVATVFGVASGTHHDIVLLDNGLDQGFRTGALCRVTRAGEPVGQIILVEVQADRAAALITELEPAMGIASGDAVNLIAQTL